MIMMRTSLETYKIWAPEDSIWSQWAKPVLFAREPLAYRSHKLEIPDVKWINSADRSTMVIVDLPRHSGVIESLGLARIGYRPVPLYNGVNAYNSRTIVNVNEIVNTLFKGADDLEAMNIRPDAPPVFMLDSNRMAGGGKERGTFDNRWCVFPQDMPSAAFLLNNGISRVIVRTEFIQNDLSHILHRYQEEGLSIYHCDGENIRKIPVAKPSKFRSLSYRFKTVMGLTRNATGGFGAFIPEAVQSNSTGARFYSYG